ncbi:putative Transmembrane protease serine 9 [Hypsibius exemplaris]|uniref:Transmembrane protease serine 9 n=1 Tax=Hypsibius exemplaris TaxID=2072580 RepID=A0A1W0WX10_HYPEX|nr:putative Transmembrane protease serine 9 [Hypsibius exemplaris]
MLLTTTTASSRDLESTLTTRTNQSHRRRRKHRPAKDATSTDDLTCGRPASSPTSAPNRRSNKNLGHRIVNGVRVPSGGMPWACAIVQSDPTFQFCDCTVINRQWVITAGHCVADPRIQTAKIYMGITNLLDAEGEKIREIDSYFLHPQFDLRQLSPDVALIKLASPLGNFSDNLMPACLPSRPVNATAIRRGRKNRRICYVAGWGTTFKGQNSGGKIGSGSDRLMQIAIEMFSSVDCRRNQPTNIAFNERTMICGGYDDGKTFSHCNGDSGGPLVCDEGDNRWVLHGIVSWVIDCARAPGGYTNVYGMMSFIRKTIELN